MSVVRSSEGRSVEHSVVSPCSGEYDHLIRGNRRLYGRKCVVYCIAIRKKKLAFGLVRGSGCGRNIDNKGGVMPWHVVMPFTVCSMAESTVVT
jgi:hypothetical protein